MSTSIDVLEKEALKATSADSQSETNTMPLDLNSIGEEIDAAFSSGRPKSDTAMKR
ncbi:hypothetical protein QWI17_19550 [Gilvimarinus sp. SDUM040013]|uniref:hypothetical protein n=1 Tax=Gilvimarinus gilvus TaxID=3058038 RepID=UPI002670D11D|nr:hypothetical protein [Gilvimarinus sp. SDUM040013]MDO3388050.1 hypothetical protein [Gilvimarinus sp. SDUM040013]